MIHSATAVASAGVIQQLLLPLLRSYIKGGRKKRHPDLLGVPPGNRAYWGLWEMIKYRLIPTPTAVLRRRRGEYPYLMIFRNPPACAVGRWAPGM